MPKDILQGIAQGPLKALQAVGDLLPDELDYVVSPAGVQHRSEFEGTTPVDMLDAGVEALQPEGVMGNLASGVTQFATGLLASFAGPGAAMGPIMRGATVDMAAFRGGDALTARLFQQNPELERPVVDYLTSDDDTYGTRLFNMLEGATVGAAFSAFKALKYLRGGKVKEAKEAVEAATVPPKPADALEPLTDVPRGSGDLEIAVNPTSVGEQTAKWESLAYQTLPERVRDMRPDLETWEDTITQASSFFDMPESEFRGILHARARIAKDTPALVMAGKRILQTQAATTKAAFLAAMKDPSLTDAAREQMVELVRIAADTRSLITAGARTTNAGNWLADDVITKLDTMLSGVAGDVDPRALFAALEPEQMVKVLDRVGQGGSITRDWFINSLLSSPKTHGVNFLNGLFNSVVMPTERAIGGLFTGNTQAVKESLRQQMYYANFAATAWRQANRAFKEGASILDPIGTKETWQSPLQPGLLRDRVDYEGTAWGWMANVVSTPVRGLIWGDEFLKQMQYRSALKARFITEGKPAGQVDDLIEQTLVDGRGTDAVALRYAREITFSTPLSETSTITKAVQQVRQTPAVNLVLPFVRTPWNIARATVHRTPGLGLMAKSMREDFAEGGAARASVVGRQATGALAVGTMLTESLGGRITGSAPRDPRERQLLLETGWQPRSIKIGDRYVSYERLEPFSLLLSAAADAAQLARDGGDPTEIIDGISMLVANNLTSTTYLRSLSEFLDGLSGDPGALQRFIYNKAATFVIPRGVDYVAEAGQDQPWPEVFSELDRLRAQLPNKGGLATRRSWLTGDPLQRYKAKGLITGANPMAVRDDVDNPVADELLRMDFTPGPPGKKMAGVDLTAEEYDRYVELSAQNRTGTKSLQDKLAEIMGRKNYQDATDATRTAYLRRTIASYRENGRKSLLKENPGLAQRIRALKKENYGAR